MDLEIVIDATKLDLATIEANRLKNRLIDEIENKGIGIVTGSGMGLGQIDLDVDLSSDRDGTTALREILKELQLDELASLRAVDS